MSRILFRATLGLTLITHALTQPPAPGEYPLAIPNTGQRINPFAPADSQFVWLRSRRPDRQRPAAES